MRIQEAIRRYRKELEEAEALAMVNEFSAIKGKAELRRLSIGPVQHKANRVFLKHMARLG